MPFIDSFDAGMDSVALFDHLHLGELRTAVTTSTDVRANWKILVENYQECLHCSWVHPELVDIVPVYKTGSVVDPARADGGVTIRGNSFSLTGRSKLPVLPHMPAEEAESYYGATVFPNMFIDVTGTSVIVSSMWPKGAGETTVVMEYLFAADTIAAAGLRSGGDRGVQRTGRQAGLRRVRAGATRRVVAILRPRSVGAAGSLDHRFSGDVPRADDRLALHRSYRGRTHWTVVSLAAR